MSGDVQPRKRKDKRRKRDDRKSEGDVNVLRQSSFEEDDESSHGVHITKLGKDDVHLHVQHQHGTGGHWCAKIIFFSLMAVLLGLVGIIIMENRGIEDFDTPLSESRYSKVFNGWVEEHRPEEHDSHEAALDDDHEHDSHEEVEQNEHEDEYEHEDEEEEADEPEQEGEEEDDDNTAAENMTAEEEEEEEQDEDADDDIEESLEPIISQSTAQSAPEAEDDAEEDEEDDDDDIIEESTEPAAQSTPDVDDEYEDNNQDDEEEFLAQKSAEPAGQSTPDADDDNEQEDDDNDFESLDQQFEDDEEEERQRQAAMLKSEPKQPELKDDNDKEEAASTTSWLGSQINPKQPSGAQDTDADDLFEQELRRANAEMINEHPARVLRAFKQLTHKHPHQPAAHLHQAQALEQLATKTNNKQLLLDAIESYKRYLAFEPTSIGNDVEYCDAAARCIEHLRSLGQLQSTVAIHKQLIEYFPHEVKQRNQLTLTQLIFNNLLAVQQLAAETLKIWPQDALAQLYYGLALKQLTADYAKALPFLEYAIASEAAGTQQAYFYLMLGETLQRLGQQRKALEVYRRGVEKNYFASIYQRSLYNVPELRAQPFWQPEETGYAEQLQQLQRHWREIRNEALGLLSRAGYFEDETEQLRDTGKWQQFELFVRGQQLARNCQRAPLTCRLLQQFVAASRCTRGQVKFSAMQAHTHVWPHCGPTNTRLRAHLTLQAPQPELTRLRVAQQERTWHEGDLLIFDDSFEHEVWHNGTQLRLVLIVDFWHPDLSPQQRQRLHPI
ncbi:Asph [Drosophila busckii]|uniref:Asph n=1 Tax=Drosophila busckii TaxID=30019 RepID=A0A0M5J9Z1_DROBS|nr:Asph [Drosophila busckii]